MRLRSLAVFPLIYGLAFIAVARWLAGGEDLASFVFWQRIVVRVLAIVGCYAAVSAFGPDDHLRSAWSWLGAGTVIILLRDLLRAFPAFQAGHAEPVEVAALSALGVLSNLALLVGIWLLAKSWKMLTHGSGSRSAFWAVAVVTASLAILVTARPVVERVQMLSKGDWSALVFLVSSVVDVILLCLITPLLLTAVSLRGGLFSWPWALVTASQLAWLLYDAAAALDPASLPAGLPVHEIFRSMAELYLFAAGMAQYLVVHHVRRAAT